jgi:hypothetical protein
MVEPTTVTWLAVSIPWDNAHESPRVLTSATAYPFPNDEVSFSRAIAPCSSKLMLHPTA